MSEWSETRYEHLSRLEGSVDVIRLETTQLDSYILLFRGMGLTIYHGWFARAERYAFLANQKEMFQLARILDGALQRDPSRMSELSLRELGDSLEHRIRFFHSHSVVETYDVREPLNRFFEPLPAVILDVEHDEKRQRHFPQPAMEQTPYPFQCTREQLLALAQDIQQTLHSSEDEKQVST